MSRQTNLLIHAVSATIGLSGAILVSKLTHDPFAAGMVVGMTAGTIIGYYFGRRLAQARLRSTPSQ
jgi:membrane protein DedA with SNARE-associated domain